MVEKMQGYTEFDSSVSFLNVTQALFASCHLARLKGDIYTWYHTLRSLETQLWSYIDEQDSAKKQQELIRNLYLRWIRMKRFRGTAVISEKLYNELENYEKFLRRIFKETGMEMKFSRDPSKAVLR